MPDVQPKRDIERNIIQNANIYRQEVLDREEGRFVVDWHGVWTIIYARARAHARFVNSRAVPVDQPWYRDWLEPDVTRFETDWELVRPLACKMAFADFTAFQEALYHEERIAPAVERLKDLVRIRQLEKKRYWDNYQRAMSQTMDAIERKVVELKGAKAAAQFTHNLAGEVLVTLATGPLGQAASLTLRARAGVVAASSILKGYGKWTDTHNVGATTVTVASELTFSFLPLLGSTDEAAKAIFLVTTPVKGSIDTGVAMIEGKLVAQALGTGAQSIALNSMGKINQLDAKALAPVLKAMSGVAIPSGASYRPGGPEPDNYPDPLSDITDIISDLLLTRDVERMAIHRVVH